MTGAIVATAPCEPVKADRGFRAPHLPALDLLRGFAILGVLWHHLFFKAVFHTGWWMTSNSPFAFMASWTCNGWLGVNLFFILSGFVLYLPFAIEQRTFAGKDDVLEFYRKRARRLLPLYYFSVILLMGVAGRFSAKEYLALLTCLFNFTNVTFMPELNAALWSLGIEIWFSLLFPFFVICISRISWRRALPGILLAALFVRLLGEASRSFSLGDYDILNPVKDSVIGRMDDFVIGMGIAALHARGYRVAHPGRVLILGLAALTATFTYADYCFSGALPPLSIALVNTLFQLSAVLLMLALLALNHVRCRPIELIGMMCYSIYIWNFVVIIHVAPSAAFTKHPWPSFLEFLSIMIPLTWLSYRYIEFGHVRQTSQLLPRPLSA
ncbi:MAG: acyltransferase [Proteobacteria bacterium]|uniref:acyltransferase family protein n=1 Tax=Rudaea sp. TaxID=2136325 RepID=UPI001DCEE583|nr:acyltransferase [Pseudomonadota bacterium]MBS0567502.1 acyltransferase [Pseudomonadota bacterium]